MHVVYNYNTKQLYIKPKPSPNSGAMRRSAVRGRASCAYHASTATRFSSPILARVARILKTILIALFEKFNYVNNNLRQTDRSKDDPYYYITIFSPYKKERLADDYFEYINNYKCEYE
jgi:hypothetical protein